MEDVLQQRSLSSHLFLVAEWHMHFCWLAGMSVYGLWAVGTVRCSLIGVSGDPSSLPVDLLFSLPQDNVNEAADEGEREGHPGQHVGVAEGRTRLLVRTHHSVDDGPTHHEQTGQDLEDGSEEEASALDQLEQLIHKGNEREEAEQHGQDHKSLNCLDPVVIAGWSAVVASVRCGAMVP